MAAFHPFRPQTTHCGHYGRRYAGGMSDKSGYDALMDDVCVKLGFCGSIRGGQVTHVDFIIPPNGPVTADQFVDWVFLADGMNPNSDAEKWQPIKDELRAAFLKHMGSEIVDAGQLQWSFAPQGDAKVHGRLPPLAQ